MPDSGTSTVTHEKLFAIKKITFAWTSTAGGVVQKTMTEAITGEIIRFVTVPGTVGDQPTNLYDITIEDSDATDILMGSGADRSNTTTQQVLASNLGCIVGDKPVFKVAAAGDTKKGTAYLYYK